jgi:hypothetical protein
MVEAVVTACLLRLDHAIHLLQPDLDLFCRRRSIFSEVECLSDRLIAAVKAYPIAARKLPTQGT